MLSVKHLKAGYQRMPVVHDVSFEVELGQIVALLGSNGSGKTTTLRAIMGGVEVMGGEIYYKGKSIKGMKTHEIAALGIAMVPEGRHLFGQMSVRDNLILGAYMEMDKQGIKDRLEEVYSLLPRVKERSSQMANTLSGGEQQMVAISRGLMAGPELLILDEPSLGLMPILVSEIFEFIKNISKMGKTIIIVEQNAFDTLKLCDYAYIMQNGEIVIQGLGQDLLTDEQVKVAYLGG